MKTVNKEINEKLKKNLNNKFDRVYINEDSIGSKIHNRCVEIFDASKISIVSEKPFTKTKSDSTGHLNSEEFNRSKKNIYVEKHLGKFFKRCPGSKPGLACCNYYVLNLGLQCDMNCSYCYLQSYINTPVLTIFSNIEDAISELKKLSMENSGHEFRIGTGETIDSLSLDELTLYSHDLIDFINTMPNWRLEFKTKSNYVDQFLNHQHKGNTIVSWSINPQYVIEKEEHLTANLNERLNAASKCLKKGFQIAFHIDPVIYFEKWEPHYIELVDKICTTFKPSDMPYVSLGALRFKPDQLFMMKQRFGMQSLVTQAEMFPSKSGKLRYDSSLRSMMFKKIIDRFKFHSEDWKVFLCMETPEQWIKTTNEVPAKDKNLKHLFKTIPLQV